MTSLLCPFQENIEFDIFFLSRCNVGTVSRFGQNMLFLRYYFIDNDHQS